MPGAALRLVVCDRPEQWNDIVLSVPGGTGYHDWRFLDLQERLSGVRFVRFLLMQGDRAVGVVPVARSARRSWRTPSVPFPFLGPVVPPELFPAALIALRRWQWRHGLVLHRFDLAPRLTEDTDASDLGVHAHEDGTVVIALAGREPAELDAGMSRLRRRSMVKAEKAGCIARRAEPGETAAILGAVLSGAYGRRDRPSPYPEDIGAVIEQWAADRDDVYLGSAFVGDRLVGSIVVLGGHPVALAWIGGVLPEFHETRTGDLMHRELIHWAAERGNLALDLSGRVDDAIERYKVSLGGAPVPYETVTSSIIPIALFEAARAVRRVADPRALADRVRAVGQRVLVDVGPVGLALLGSVPSAFAEIGTPLFA